MFILKLELLKRKLRLLKLDCVILFMKLENKFLNLLCYIKYDLLVGINYRFNCLRYGKKRYREMLWQEIDAIFEEALQDEDQVVRVPYNDEV